jgi:translation initiation factor 1
MSKKNRINVVYSTNPDFEYEYESPFKVLDTLEPNKQNLRVVHDAKRRKGKIVTLVTGFVGSEDDLKDLGKALKTKCGVGGSVKHNEIIIQGQFREKVIDLLKDMGYKAK